MQGTCKACEFNDFFHCPTIKAIDKALAWATYLEF
jgi:hypothetical protein